jgi:hypothetical protein
MRFCQVALATVLAAVAVAAGGCGPSGPRERRIIASGVQGSLTAEALRTAYRAPAFVVRDVSGGKFAAVQDTGLAAGSQIDDTNLLILAEGAGDTVDGFRATARLVAESPCGFPPRPERLLVVLLRWSESANPVAEHMNHAGQAEGAARLGEMLEVHRLRHGAGGHVSIVGFSAGTRVIEKAFAGAAGKDGAGRAEAFACVENIVFLGSSVGSEERMPFGPIRGRFINFVNPRDTHFGDRVAYVAPAGEKANPLKLLQQATIQRRPRFGASVAGFHDLPVLTAARQFDGVEALEHSAAPPDARQAFKMINVPVPLTLVPFNVFGSPVLDDDLDDYLNLAPNHYILVGRGPAGRTDMADFKQYRAAAEEFVKDFVVPAAVLGRLERFDLKTASKGADPLGLPLPVPWAILKGVFEGPSPPPDEKGTAPQPEKK